MAWRIGCLVLLAACGAGCGGESGSGDGSFTSTEQPPSPSGAETGVAPGPGPQVSTADPSRAFWTFRTPPALSSVLRVDESDGGGSTPQPIWQPGFHQALRWSFAYDGRVTYRFKIPVLRGGARIRIAFRSGDRSAFIARATVARAGSGGALASAPLEVTFNGNASVSLAAGDRVVSDPVALRVSPKDELYVSFSGDGAFAKSAIKEFPDSYAAWGDHAGDASMPVDGIARPYLTGVNTLEVEGPYEPTFVAIGDSITEGYVSGNDDVRNAWPFKTSDALGHPVVNGSVSGQGLYDANQYVHDDVLVLAGGVSDCVVLLGTNDLAVDEVPKLEDRLGTLFAALKPVCRVWAGTLLPKEKTDVGDLTVVNQRREQLNQWLKSGTVSVDGVIDFETATAAPNDPNHFQPGFGEDGIHPSLKGQAAMAVEAAKMLTVVQ